MLAMDLGHLHPCIVPRNGGVVELSTRYVQASSNIFCFPSSSDWNNESAWGMGLFLLILHCLALEQFTGVEQIMLEWQWDFKPPESRNVVGLLPLFCLPTSLYICPASCNSWCPLKTLCSNSVFEEMPLT